MKRNLKSAAALLLALVLCLALAPAAFAENNAGSATPTATIPVTMTIGNLVYDPLDRAAGLAYTIELVDKSGSVVQTIKLTDGNIIAKDDNAKGEAYVYQYTGAFTLSYDGVGIHNYTVRQNVSPDTAGYDKYCKYWDTKEYSVTVTVANHDPNNVSLGLFDVYVAIHDGETKPEAAAFSNAYYTPVVLQKKWAGDAWDINSPDVAFTVYSSANDTVGVTVPITAADGYYGYLSAPYDYTRIGKANMGYTVKETLVPSGYSAGETQYVVSDDGNGLAASIKNSRILIQTGQLNWPIPLLCAAGVMFVGLGAVLLFKGKKRGDA